MFVSEDETRDPTGSGNCHTDVGQIFIGDERIDLFFICIFLYIILL
jgi:hypothetical protein